MSTTLSRTSDAAIDAQLPAEGLRTVVSLLLIVHLFAVAVVMFSHASTSLSGEDRNRELLSQRLRSFLYPYLQLLYQDEWSNSRNLRLTHDEFADLDYQVIFDLKLPDGQTKTIVLPEPDLQPGQRRQRMQAFANKAGQRLVLENLGTGEENVLPRMLAQYLVTKYKATGGEVRIRGHQLIEPGRVAGVDAALTDPYNAAYYMTPYRATILVRAGIVQPLLKVVAAGETAPTPRGRVTPVPNTPPQPLTP